MARPKLGDSETERLHVKITKDELSEIDEWRYLNRVPSRSEAVRRLCKIGLNAHPYMQKSARDAHVSCEKIYSIAEYITDELANKDADRSALIENVTNHLAEMYGSIAAIGESLDRALLYEGIASVPALDDLSLEQRFAIAKDMLKTREDEDDK